MPPRPPSPAPGKPSWEVTSVQHDVVDHVALVFGVVEAEGTAQVFGALLRNSRVPGFHVHSKSRSGGEAGGRQAISVTRDWFARVHTPCWRPGHRLPVRHPCLRAQTTAFGYGCSPGALGSPTQQRTTVAQWSPFWEFCHLAGFKLSIKGNGFPQILFFFLSIVDRY